MEEHQTETIILQCDIDSLPGSHPACFALSLLGHFQCIPCVICYFSTILLLGDSTYTISNAARYPSVGMTRIVNRTLFNGAPCHVN